MNLYVPAMIEILLISVSVAMDAFAVSIGKGLTVTRVRPVDVIKTALWFGGFQALFPLLGFFAANTFSKYVTAVDHWIIFALLAFIGGNMIRGGVGALMLAKNDPGAAGEAAACTTSRPFSAEPILPGLIRKEAGPAWAASMARL